MRYSSALEVVIAGFMRFGIGYFTPSVNCKLVDHRLGIVRWSKILHKLIDYEPPWRYYYIIRNSIRLLIEGRIDPAFYIGSSTAS